MVAEVQNFGGFTSDRTRGLHDPRVAHGSRDPCPHWPNGLRDGWLRRGTSEGRNTMLEYLGDDYVDEMDAPDDFTSEAITFDPYVA